jgi:predicted metal-dependent phosphoesterase TrpH
MMKFDLHIHTTLHSPDSAMDPEAMVRRAQELGLDGVVITEHDWLWSEAELADLRARADGLVVLGGIEVSAEEGHFLVHGVRDPFAFPRGIGVAELCRRVHAQGGAVVAAHPFRWGQPFDEILRTERPELDGLELMTNNMDDDLRRQAVRVWKDTGLAGLGSSDAHEVRTLAVCYTEFDADIRTGADLAAAIRARRTVARERAPQSKAG